MPKIDKFAKVYLMKYLAFDIEAANGYKPSSVCSIGVVIADEHFNVLSRENIWINPKTQYNLNGTRENVGINLELDKALLDASPDFRRVYPKIRGLLTDTQYVVLGHAVDSDVRMLNAACVRYHLPSINFEFICSQLLYKLYRGDREVRGLDKIANELGVTFHQHNSEQDAYVSLLTLKFLTEDSGLSVEELLAKYQVRKGSNNNFELKRPVSLLGQISKKKRKELALEMSRGNMTAKEFLKLHWQSADQVDVNASVARFLTEMQQGLNGQGGLPMIPTYLTDVDRSKIKTGAKRILIDAGGTNFRSAIGYFDEQGKVVIEDLRKTVMPASDRELSKEEFYTQIAKNVERLLPKAQDVGFCFSYQVEMGADVDGTVGKFSKEVKAPEVVGTRVGAETLAACKQLDGADRRIVILNDTVATLLGGMATTNERYSAYLGYIYGTGTNVCYVEDTAKIAKVTNLARGRMLVNTECGNFSGFVQGDFDKAAIAKTADPTRQQFEKMTSGKYLADVICEALALAKKEKVFAGEVTLRPFALKDVSSFLAGGEFPCQFAVERDKTFAAELCVELIRRAAKMGAIVNSALAIASCSDKSLPVAVVCEGTTFNKLPHYREFFQAYLRDVLGQHGISYKILQGEDLNLVGTLMATMVLD